MADKQRVLLIRPRCNKKPAILMPPLGMMLIAARLRRSADVEVRLIDMEVSGLDHEGLHGALEQYAPHVIGLSALNFESEDMHAIASLAKTWRPQVPVVVGGPYPTAYTDDVMGDQNVDYAVIGEGELVMEGLCAALRKDKAPKDIGGLCVRKSEGEGYNPPSHLCRPKDLDELDFPAWDLIDIPAYPRLFDRMSRTGRGEYMPILTSRACPYKCIYCHKLFGEVFRPRSPEDVAAEIEELHRRYKIVEFEIVDDCFNYDLDRAKAIFAALIALDLNLHLTFPAALRGDRLDEEFFELGSRAGVRFIAFALETASHRLQKLIRKNLDLHKTEQAIRQARSRGIFCQGFFMLGFPTETEQEMQGTVEYACRLPLDAAVFLMVTAFEGSPLAELVRSRGKPIYQDFNQNYLSSEFANLTDIPTRRINRLRRVAVLRFWLNPLRLVSFANRYPNPRRLPQLSMVWLRRLLFQG